jgi:2,3-bisphosphoglycerate-dependent phosphoglycerate mutase
MELTIIRHAQSTNNALPSPKNRVCDPQLTELGHRQAEILAQHLATGQRLAPWQADPFEQGGYSITRLYCSPMCRSLQTTQPIERALGLTPEVWIDIHERGGIYLDHGEAGDTVGYPGKTRAEILSEFPSYALPEGITEQGWWRHQGREDRQTFYGRAIQVAFTLRKWATSDERIALVTHGDFINGLLKALFNQLPGAGIAYRHLNAAITSICLQGDGKLTVAYLNRVDHLPPGLIS